MTGNHSAPGNDELTSIEVTLTAEPTSVRQARALVSEQWSDLDQDTVADVELIVSELVTNAIRHGEPDIVLKLRLAPFAIDIAVLDHGAGEPAKQDAETTATSGRGLAIIDTLAMDWGCDALDGKTGKIVWASVERN